MTDDSNSNAFPNSQSGDPVADPEMIEFMRKQQGQLNPDDPMEIQRDFELDPNLFIKEMNAPAERETDA